MEVEIRVAVDSFTKIEDKVRKLGARLIKEKNQTDIYFGEISLYKKIGYSFMMRIRDEEGRIFLTYKGAKTEKDGEWEEYEFAVPEKTEAVEMLKAMGMEKIIEVKKKRKEYKLKNFSICLDNIQGFGHFIEVECLSKNVSGSKKRLKELMINLGIRNSDIIHKGYITLLLSKINSPYSKYIKH